MFQKKNRMASNKIPCFQDSFHDYCATKDAEDSLIFKDNSEEMEKRKDDDSYPSETHEIDIGNIVYIHEEFVALSEEEYVHPVQSDIRQDDTSESMAVLNEGREFSSFSEVEKFMANYMNLSKSAFVKSSNNARQVNYTLFIFTFPP